MHCIALLVMLSVMLLQSELLSAPHDPMSDTWVATDALGRELPTYEECGPVRDGKCVGMFYFIWLGQHFNDVANPTGPYGPYDTSKILAENPENPQWGPLHLFHWWSEPELGYYISDDEYVIRKHAHLLAEAGVDVIIVDVTNSFTYDKVRAKLCEVYSDIRAKGNPTPQIAFFSWASAGPTVQKLYDDFYSKGLYKDLWFYWKGKPLILAPADQLSAECREFFTCRKTWGLNKPDEPYEWSFLQHYPQGPGWAEEGVVEQMTVSIAQQDTYITYPTAHGRSYHDGKQPPHEKCNDLGLNYKEQWERALEIDPDFVFITGWNEWIAQRFEDEHGNTRFVDSFSKEFSRDIEPMKGGYTDSYYYQTVDFIRRYKGVRKPEPASSKKTIDLNGDFNDWVDVNPEYRDAIGDTAHRNHPGFGSAGPYVGTTGRNDIIRCKTTYDDTYVYFYVETADPITQPTQGDWMLLFINADQNSITGWNGYDYLVNYSVIDDSKTTLKSNAGGWNWEQVENIDYKLDRKRMHLRIPRSSFGQSERVAFDFHWHDNLEKENDIIQFGTTGDSAPDRRFNYRYR